MTESTADPSLSMAGAAHRRREYLLAIDKDRSFVVAIPAAGELVIGRGPEAGLNVDDPLVSRAHAQLLVTPDGLRIEDLGSRHGTFVNGEHVEAPRLVGSGDVIGIGSALFVVRRPARVARAAAAGGDELVRRLGEELARAAEYDRPGVVRDVPHERRRRARSPALDRASRRRWGDASPPSCRS